MSRCLPLFSMRSEVLRRMVPVALARAHWGQLHPTFGVPIASPVPMRVIFMLQPVQVADRVPVPDHADALLDILPGQGLAVVHERREDRLLDHHAEVGTREAFG